MPKTDRIQLGSALEICISKSIINNQKWYFISHAYSFIWALMFFTWLEFEAQNIRTKVH